MNEPRTDRLNDLHTWLCKTFEQADICLRPLAGDASLRRYFRFTQDGTAYIVMDSPPEHASVGDFVDITRRLKSAHVSVPEIIAANIKSGYLVLSDLGAVHYLDVLHSDNAQTLYDAALDTLVRMQRADTQGLPDYDRQRLNDEMALFEPWFLQRHLDIRLTSRQWQVLTRTMDCLSDKALLQPRYFVHRDYHSRNLMFRAGEQPGVLDFQDATRGPITYDLVSLLRDVYIVWPQASIEQWLAQFYEEACREQRLHCSFDTFQCWFDYMGVQRHLKIAGIFCRLFYRDAKPGYLHDIPVALRYLREITAKYDELADLHQLMVDLEVERRLREANTSAGVT